jgi:hypothetical protein
MQQRNSFESHISLIGGRISAPRCQALSKRSQMQCRKAALTGKRVCMFHGGKSTGPVTEDARKRPLHNTILGDFWKIHYCFH